jgi:hypothetical protein
MYLPELQNYKSFYKVYKYLEDIEIFKDQLPIFGGWFFILHKTERIR